MVALPLELRSRWHKRKAQATLTRSVCLSRSLALGDSIQNPKSKIQVLETLVSASPQIIAGFHALSEPIRIQTIELLRSRELCVCDLCELLALNQSKLSFHLKVLKTAELVHTRQEGKWIYYRLNLAQFAVLENYLSDYRQQTTSLPTRICC